MEETPPDLPRLAASGAASRKFIGYVVFSDHYGSAGKPIALLFTRGKLASVEGEGNRWLTRWMPKPLTGASPSAIAKLMPPGTRTRLERFPGFYEQSFGVRLPENSGSVRDFNGGLVLSRPGWRGSTEIFAFEIRNGKISEKERSVEEEFD